MEIDAVAECNRASVYKGRRLKLPIFSDLPVLKEQTTDSKPPPVSLPHLSTDSFTATLLAISESADDEAHRLNLKARKRSSRRDQFGPWLFDERWLPRKRPSPSRNRKISSSFRRSPTRFMSPDRSLSPRRRNRHPPPQVAAGKYDPVGNQAGGWGGTEGGLGIDHSQEFKNSNNHKDRFRPSTVPCHSSSQDGNNRYMYKHLDSPQSWTETNNGTKGIRYGSGMTELYPRHSLPTVITLRSADSSNSYDTVFSLGKYDLSRKDIIFSMGQSNRMCSTVYTRQAKSATCSDVITSASQNESRQHEVLNDIERDKHYGKSNKDYVVTSRSVEDPKSLVGNFELEQSPPPMCEYEDISQHMRYYRMHHTVNLTGRSSLANEPAQESVIESVQWDELFPHRPLSNTMRSATTVPVFRFSVSDFQKEHSNTSDKDHQKENETNSSSLKSVARLVKSELHRASESLSNKPRSRMLRAALASSSDHSQSGAPGAKRNSNSKARHVTISLTPTVRPVLHSPRTSTTPDGAGCRGHRRVNTPRPDGEERLINYECSYKEGDQEFNGEVVDGNKETEFNNSNYDNHDNHDNNKGANGITYYNMINHDGNQPSAERNNEMVKAKEERAANNVSRLSKTQAYIKSTYSVYNDTIQSVSASDSAQVTDYREYLKRKRNLAKGSLSLETDHGNGSHNVHGDESFTYEDRSIQTRSGKTPQGVSNILKDTMGIPRYRNGFKSIKSNRYVVSDSQLFSCTRQFDGPWDGHFRELSQIKAEEGARPTLKIDAQQLRESVDRKLYEGNKLLSKHHFTSRSMPEYDDKFVRFQVKEDRDQIRLPQSFRGRYHQNAKRAAQLDRSMESNVDTALKENGVKDPKCDLGVAGDSIGNTINVNELSVDTRPSGHASGDQTQPLYSVANNRKVWKPNASRWNMKLQERPESRSVSSSFHYHPTPSSASAYVIANPPLQMGFDDRSVVLPLDDFVQMAMKSREGSFSALSKSVNTRSKVGIAPNAMAKSRSSSNRKSPDDGLVRVVSFATPVNQFIFAKRITGYTLGSNAHSSMSTTAEEEGRTVFQRKMAGTFRLNWNEVGENKTMMNDLNNDDNEKEVGENKTMMNDLNNDDNEKEVGENKTMMNDINNDDNEKEVGENKTMMNDINNDDNEKEVGGNKIMMNDLNNGDNEKEETGKETQNFEGTTMSRSPRDEKTSEIIIEKSLNQNRLSEKANLGEECLNINFNMETITGDHGSNKSNKEHNTPLDILVDRYTGREDNASQEKRKIHSVLRDKVVRLAEMDVLNDSHANADKNRSQDLLTRPSSVGHPSELPVWNNDYEDPVNDIKGSDSLQSKFAELKRRRKKALHRNAVLKQQLPSLVRKLLPAATTVTQAEEADANDGPNALTKTTKTTKTDVIFPPVRADGGSPLKQSTATVASRTKSSRCPKTVRFACDGTDIQDQE